MPYIIGERKQALILPSSIEDYIRPDDPVRAYDAFVDQLNFEALGIHLDPHQVGHPEFDPAAMVKLLVYGYSYGIRSSRKLERATHHNLSFIWLTGGLKPDHKTIARFRRNNTGALKNILKQCAHICIKLGLIEGNTLFVDGTKIRANASMKNTWTEKRCLEALGEIDKRIESLLNECEQIDQAEEDRSSLVKMDQGLRDQSQLKAQIQEILGELKESDKTAVNTTDPESGRFRKGPAQIDVGCNCQTVVDDKHGLIVHADVVSEGNDQNQFSPQIEAAQKTLGRPCQTACADAGYAGTEDLKKVLDSGVDVVVPSVRQVKEPSQKIRKEHFIYDRARDFYRCPEGHELKYVGDHKKNKSRVYMVSSGSVCRTCPQFGKCTTAIHGRRVERMFLEDVRERIEERYRQPDAQAIYYRRKLRVEHPFGHMKQNLGIRSFLLRGIAGVRAEAAIAGTCFNLTRIMTLIGVEGLVKRLSTA